MKDLLEKLKVAFEQLQESSVYQTLEEKYISLTPKAQKLVQIGALVLGVLLLCLPTYSFFASSRSYQKTFLEDRGLLRDLIQVSSLPSRSIGAGMSLEQAQQQALQIAQGQDLLPEQISPPVPQPANSVEKLSQLKHSVFELPFKQLTLTQLVTLGQAFDKLPALKLMGLDIQASAEDAHYYDVRFQLVHFEWPAATGGAAPNKSAPNKSAPQKSAPDKSASLKSTPDRSTLDEPLPSASTLDTSAPKKSVPDKSASHLQNPQQGASS